MKKFQYRLENVLTYKNQVLDDLKSQQAEIASRVNRKKEEIRVLNRELTEYGDGFDHLKETGADINGFRLYDMCILRMKDRIDEEQSRLEILKKKEAEKKKEVVAAKIDTSRYEKLKEKKFREYQKAAMKAEEADIEEFVSGKTIRRARSGLSPG